MSVPAGNGTTPGRHVAAPPGEEAQRLTVALRAWLSWHGLEQQDLAAVLGVSDSAVSRLISPARSRQRRGALARLVAALVGRDVGLCLSCGELLPDGELAAELLRLLEARRA